MYILEFSYVAYGKMPYADIAKEITAWEKIEFILWDVFSALAAVMGCTNKYIVFKSTVMM